MFIIDRLQKITLALTAVLCLAAIAVVLCIKPEAQPAPEKFIPVFDSEAVEGVPKIADKSALYSTMNIPLTSGNCRVSMNASPEINDNKLDVYFTNSEENNVGIKLVIYDENENIIGESGIIKSGEYVKSVEINGNVTGGSKLEAKILTYENETYYSLGSACAVISVK